MFSSFDELYNQLPFPITDPVLVFGLVMLIIFLAPLLFRRYKIPGIIGLILFGAFVGPSALGLLDRDATIILLGTVGLIYLMFMAGLSIDLNEFKKMRGRSAVFGLSTFFIPQILALIVGLYLLNYSIESSLLLGSIVGSHTLLAYPLARRLGITKNKAVTMVLGGSIVSDLVALIVLAVVMASLGGDLNTWFWIKFISSITLFGVGIIIFLPKLGRWFFRNVQDESSTEYAFLLCCLFISAALAQAIGLAPIIGAFLAGLALNSLIPENSTSMLRIQFVGDALLVPFFLISVGMLVDFQVLFSSLDVWIYALVFTTIVYVGKISAAKISQWIFSYSKNEFGVISGLTTPQAAATLAVTLVGFEVGLFSQNAVNAVVLMILITCIIGPMLVEKYGRLLAVEEDEVKKTPEIGHHRFLIPLANPTTASSLIDLAILIRDPSSVEPLLPLIVANDGDNVQAQVAHSEKMLGHAVLHATAANVPVQPVTRVDLNIASGIVRATKELRISAIVIGWNGQVSTQQRIFGSVLDKILSDTHQLLFVCKLVRPINTNTRVILIIPPYVEREFGFPAALRAIKLLSSQLDAGITVFTLHENAKRITEINKTIKPDFDIKFETASSWNDLMVMVRSRLNNDDLCVLVSVKEDGIGWQPSLNTLPRTFAELRPDMNLVTVYASDISSDYNTSSPSNTDPGIKKLLNSNECHFDLKASTISDSVRELLSYQLSDENEENDALIEDVLKSANEGNPEITKGVYLLHGNVSTLSYPKLILGIHKEGLRVKDNDHKIHILFILLRPNDQSPQEHLQNLASIAHLVRSEEVIQLLKKASKASDLHQFMN
jgi:Kef-type K+ transport system membrane component KefB/mannitol/fructose-specific phosphotransferase system IIA component (Ntr-type)/nucleotide-binding universal stress UspA family protein